LWADVNCHKGLETYFDIDFSELRNQATFVAYRPSDMMVIKKPHLDHFSEASGAEFIKDVLDGDWGLKVIEKIRPIEDHVDGIWDECYPDIPKDWSREPEKETEYERYFRR